MMRKDLPKDGRGTAWTVIVYEDSCPDWRTKLCDMSLKAMASPLHDRDVNEDGEPKKPHRHVLIDFGKTKKSAAQVQEISDELSGVKVDPKQCLVRTMRGAVRYLVHYDDPSKAQYDPAGIECFGGADYLEHFEDASDVDKSVGEMMEWLDNDEYASFSALARYARDHRPDWFRTLTVKRTVFVKAYAQAVGYERKVSAMAVSKAGVVADSERVRRCIIYGCDGEVIGSLRTYSGADAYYCAEHESDVLMMMDRSVEAHYKLLGGDD